MLKHLYIKNFILISELDLDFNTGFSVFTGETGAGKSILIDAIGLLTGNRADTSIIRKGSNKCIIEGVFDINNNQRIKQLLSEAEIDYDSELVVSRIIDASNKSSVRINHRSVTLSFIKNIFSQEIDIHSQHNTQYLLQKNNHLKLLDIFCNNQELLNDVKQAYINYANLKKEYNDKISKTYNESDLEFFQYQINEIDAANLVIGEDIDLQQQEKEIKQFEKSYDAIKNALEIFNSDDGINDLLAEFIFQLQGSKLDKITELNQRVNNAYQELIDVNEEINSYFDDFNFDEETINNIQARLFEINNLKRKYGATINAILDKKAEIQNQIDIINNRQIYIEEMEAKIASAYQVFNTKAHKLHLIRVKQAKILEKQIIQELASLELKNAEFSIKIADGKPSQTGLDDIEFFISLNKGANLQALNKVASGGELSRLMLGLKVIFTKLANIKTIIFDEIDTGVSGKVATSIGLKMAKLGKEVQVFSVTHLAQVAACGSYHYHISKNSDEQITNSVCKLLSKQERIDNLADLAYGKISEVNLSASKELLEENQEMVKNLK